MISYMYHVRLKNIMSILIDKMISILFLVPNFLSKFPSKCKNRLEMMICILNSHSKKITLFESYEIWSTTF